MINFELFFLENFLESSFVLIPSNLDKNRIKKHKRKMNREIKFLDIFCYSLFFLLITTKLCRADEGNEKVLCLKKKFRIKFIFGIHLEKVEKFKHSKLLPEAVKQIRKH